MKIIVKEDSHNISLCLPTGLMLNPCVAGIACREAKKHGAQLSRRQMNRLFNVLKDYRNTHPDWVLVEVRRANGGYVQVKL